MLNTAFVLAYLVPSPASSAKSTAYEDSEYYEDDEYYYDEKRWVVRSQFTKVVILEGHDDVAQNVWL